MAEETIVRPLPVAIISSVDTNLSMATQLIKNAQYTLGHTVDLQDQLKDSEATNIRLEHDAAENLAKMDSLEQKAAESKAEIEKLQKNLAEHSPHQSE